MTCDSLILTYSHDSCSFLEETYGCDCSGCACPTVEHETGTCSDNCGGENCDHHLAVTGVSSCEFLEDTYDCDCSGCACVANEFETGACSELTEQPWMTKKRFCHATE